MSLAGFGGVLVWARRGIVDQHKWMTADEFNETFALCHFLPGPNIVNLTFVFGSRFRGIPGAVAAFSGLVGPPALIMVVMGMLYHRYGEIDALRRILSGVACAAIGLMLAVVFRMMTPLIKRRDVIALLVMVAVFVAIGVLRLPLAAVLLAAIPVSIAITYATRQGGGMNSDSNPVSDAGVTFATMSLFAVGGANSAIPEMHRVAVDVNHWLTDKQFTDVYAIAQLSPGPNVLIVTLIGYSVGGPCSARWSQRSRCACRRRCSRCSSAASWRARAMRAGLPSFRRRWCRCRSD